MEVYQRNNYLLPAMAFFNSFASVEVSIGGLLLIRSMSASLLVNGSVSSISSIGLIICTLFIGAKLDNVNKKKSLTLFNALMFVSLLVPFFSNSKLFVILFICSDVFVSLFSLIETLSFSGSIKQLVTEKALEKVVNWNSAFGMIGIIVSICVLSGVTLMTRSFKSYLPIGSGAYFLNCLLSIGLVQRSEELAEPVHFNTLDHLKRVALSIKQSEGLRKSIVVSIVFTLVQTVFNSLLIYYWNEIDPSYSKIGFLIVAYGVGISLGIYLIRFERNQHFMFLLVFALTMILIIMDLEPSVYIMSGCIVAVMAVTIPMTNLARKIRIKHTGMDVQSAQESFVEFGSSTLEVLFGTVLAGGAQLLRKSGLVLVLVGLFALTTMIGCQRGMYVYAKEHSR